MHIAFLNPQGNFDLADRYWTEHPDFGGQLVYVKWERTAQGYLAEIERVLAGPHHGRENVAALPLHPFFQSGQPENAISTAELSALYFVE